MLVSGARRRKDSCTNAPSVVHVTDQYANNRAEVSHQPTRQRERQMRRFTSAAQLQRFASVHGIVQHLFRVSRHLLRSAHHRLLRTRAFVEWDGASEMVRQLKVARDTAVKARSSAIITLKTLIVNAPGELRETLEPLTDRKLIDCCADLEPGDIVDPTTSVKHALRALATRWLMLSKEIGTHDEVLDRITTTAAPTLREAFGIGPDSAAEMMIVAGDNPERIRSDAAFAKLCGACPIPAVTCAC